MDYADFMIFLRVFFGMTHLKNVGIEAVMKVLEVRVLDMIAYGEHRRKRNWSHIMYDLMIEPSSPTRRVAF